MPEFEVVAALPEEVDLGVNEGIGEWVFGCTIGYLTPSPNCGGMHVAFRPFPCCCMMLLNSIALLS